MADTIITLTKWQYNCLKDELQVYWRRFSKAAKVYGLTADEQDAVDRALLALTLSLSAIRYGGKRWGLPATAVIVRLACRIRDALAQGDYDAALGVALLVLPTGA